MIARAAAAVLLIAISAAPVTGQSRDTIVQRINAEAARIRDSLGKLVCAARGLPDRSTEGGELRTCSDGRGLRFASAEFFGETGRAREQFFFTRGGELILVSRTERTYTAPMSGRVRARTDQEFLFKQRSLIRWSDRRWGVRPLGTSDARLWESRLIAFADTVASAQRQNRRAEPE